MGKGNEQQSFEKRLKVYAAAAAGTLALAPPANAAIHYTKPPAPLVVGITEPLVPISMENNPSNSEFNFLWFPSGTPSGVCNYFGIQGLATFSADVGWLGGPGGINLQEGAIISINAPYGFNWGDQLLNNSGTCNGVPLPCQGAFCPPAENGYLGVRFKLNGKTLYGWIQYQGTAGASGTIIDWAYEDSGGAIWAGQKQSSSVPTFTEWGLYLFAALLVIGGIIRLRNEEEMS
jgi:hypothetical protein